MKKCGIIIVLVFVVQLAFTQQAITVEKSGEGTPLVFLPGFTSPGSVWNETIENLEGTYECFTVSYAGFGGLAPIGFPWFEGVKQQMIAYIEKENLMNVTLIGHSMGGNLAIDVAANDQRTLEGSTTHRLDSHVGQEDLCLWLYRSYEARSEREAE